ncbi:MAG: DUF4390 domain-containing protein [Candidatus Sulfobium sp.]|jgi:Domain of unknown function (DUF4390)
MSRLLAISLLLACILLPSLSEGQEISGPEVNIRNGVIHVHFGLNPGQKFIQGIKAGIDKELKFYIDLFRIWKIWPDEFIVGRSFTRTLKVDPIKEEYVATSLNGNVLIEKRFRSFDSMVSWVVSFKDVKLASTRDLEPGQYFVRVTVESRIRKLPPVIGYFIIFLSENEFKVHKDSGMFTIGGNR